MPAELASDPIIVFGAPRSGTTYLERILNAHPAVFVTHETRVFAWLNQALRVLPRDDRFLLSYREAFVDRLRNVLPREIRDFYRSIAPDVRYWGDKNPQYADPINPGCLELIDELFPGTLFIHIIRDGRDVVSSHLRFEGSQAPWANFEDAHARWAGHVDRGRAFGRTLPPSRYLELRYEELVTNDIAASGEVFRFLGLDLHPDVEAFCRSQHAERTPFSEPTRQLEKGVTASDWATIFSPEEQARSLDLIGAHLVRYGYETDASISPEQQAHSLELIRAQLIRYGYSTDTET